MIPERWREDYSRDIIPVDSESVATTCCNPLKVGGKPKSENQRYNEVMSVTTKLTQLAKSCGGEQYAGRLKALKKVADLWERRKEVAVYEIGKDHPIHSKLCILSLLFPSLLGAARNQSNL